MLCEYISHSHEGVKANLQDAAGSVRGHEPHEGASGCCKGQCVDGHKVQLLCEALSPLADFPQQAGPNGEDFLDGQLLDKGWVCHEPANNVASKLRRGNDRCQRPVWDLVCTDDPGQAEAIPRV